MKGINLLVVLCLIGSLLAACGGGTTEEAETVGTQPTSAPTEGPAATATPTSPPEPAVGGTWVYATGTEPDTLDVHRTVSGVSENVMKLVGGAVLTIDPVTEEFVPYLAESYSLSDDGLTWEIKFKEGLVWHDGTLFTAEDYVWTMERVLATPSPATGAMTDGMASAEALDDLTVRIYMDRPNTGMEFGLTSAYMQPLPRAYIERVGDDEYGRHPIGMGPYKFKEWRTGDRLILERNPDFNWTPLYTRGGAPYIEFVEFRVVPEYATRLAGLETGEIDSAVVLNKDVKRVKELGIVEVYPIEFQGAGPYLLFNVSKPPFDDILVRKAFNLAIDRETLVKTVGLGYGEPLWGVISPATYGHWDGDKEIGYGYDLEAAKELMAQAGYVLNDDGVLVKDGQPLEIPFIVNDSTRGDPVKTAQVLLEKFKDLGVVLDLQELEYGVLQDAFASGDYVLSISSWGWAEAQIIFPIFLSSMIGGMNESKVNDPEFDGVLMNIVLATNREDLQEALDAVQQYAIEKAYVAPLFSVVQHLAISQRTQGALIRRVTEEIELFDAYVETTH
jgi:peptide/nickel transport system substrate-binding protein